MNGLVEGVMAMTGLSSASAGLVAVLGVVLCATLASVWVVGVCEAVALRRLRVEIEGRGCATRISRPS